MIGPDSPEETLAAARSSGDTKRSCRNPPGARGITVREDLVAYVVDVVARLRERSGAVARAARTQALLSRVCGRDCGTRFVTP